MLASRDGTGALGQVGHELGACGGIQLLCGEKPLPYEYSLLTARVFVWRQGGDMALLYAEA